jgi:hypothetical protein
MLKSRDKLHVHPLTIHWAFVFLCVAVSVSLKSYISLLPVLFMGIHLAVSAKKNARYNLLLVVPAMLFITVIIARRLPGNNEEIKTDDYVSGHDTLCIDLKVADPLNGVYAAPFSGSEALFRLMKVSKKTGYDSAFILVRTDSYGLRTVEKVRSTLFHITSRMPRDTIIGSGTALYVEPSMPFAPQGRPDYAYWFGPLSVSNPYHCGVPVWTGIIVAVALLFALFIAKRNIPVHIAMHGGGLVVMAYCMAIRSDSHPAIPWLVFLVYPLFCSFLCTRMKFLKPPVALFGIMILVYTFFSFGRFPAPFTGIAGCVYEIVFPLGILFLYTITAPSETARDSKGLFLSLSVAFSLPLLHLMLPLHTLYGIGILFSILRRSEP